MSADVEYDRESHQDQVRDWVRDVVGPAPSQTLERNGLSGALYAFCELNLFCDDIDSVTPELAIQIWSVVEACRRKGFPKTLEM